MKMKPGHAARDFFVIGRNRARETAGVLTLICLQKARLSIG
jgi:hypothetical protein